jgi:hypothetical protein
MNQTTGRVKPPILRRTDNLGSGKVGERVGGAPASEAAHFYVCPECGQAVDKRDLGQVFHHEQVGHEPLPEDWGMRIVWQIVGLLALLAASGALGWGVHTLVNSWSRELTISQDGRMQ